MLHFRGLLASSSCISALATLVILAQVNAQVDPTADNSVVLDLDECPRAFLPCARPIYNMCIM